MTVKSQPDGLHDPRERLCNGENKLSHYIKYIYNLGRISLWKRTAYNVCFPDSGYAILAFTSPAPCCVRNVIADQIKLYKNVNFLYATHTIQPHIQQKTCFFLSLSPHMCVCSSSVRSVQIWIICVWCFANYDDITKASALDSDLLREQMRWAPPRNKTHVCRGNQLANNGPIRMMYRSTNLICVGDCGGIYFISGVFMVYGVQH